MKEMDWAPALTGEKDGGGEKCGDSGESRDLLIRLQRNLNFVLSILNALILWSRVDGGIPSLAAAPEGPETRPLVSASTASIVSRSVRRSSPRLKSGDASTRGAGKKVSLESHDSSTEKTSPELRITDL